MPRMIRSTLRLPSFEFLDIVLLFSLKGGFFYFTQFHYKTNQGIKCFDRQQADDMSRDDPDFAIRDLYNAIAEGDFPSYTMFIQVMTFQEAEHFPFNPFDLTKVWSHATFPLIPVGKLVLNKNPKNYFAEVGSNFKMIYYS